MDFLCHLRRRLDWRKSTLVSNCLELLLFSRFSHTPEFTEQERQQAYQTISSEFCPWSRVCREIYWDQKNTLCLGSKWCQSGPHLGMGNRNAGKCSAKEGHQCTFSQVASQIDTNSYCAYFVRGDLDTSVIHEGVQWRLKFLSWLNALEKEEK